MGPIPSAKTQWPLFTGVPGVGVSVTDAAGNLLFVNKSAMEFFEGHTDIDYEGKTIGDFHPPEFVQERLEAIGRVLKSKNPLMMSHVFLGRRLESTLFPIKDRTAPRNRVVVVTQQATTTNVPDGMATFETKYVDLGPLDVLSPRELEVLVLLGHGLTVPQAAKKLHRSPKTVERHKSAISKKLKVNSQAAIVRLVALVGLTMDDVEKTRLSESPVEKKPPELPNGSIR